MNLETSTKMKTNSILLNYDQSILGNPKLMLFKNTFLIRWLLSNYY